MSCQDTLTEVYQLLRGAAEQAKLCNTTLSINAALVGTPAGLPFLGKSLRELGRSEEATARGVATAPRERGYGAGSEARVVRSKHFRQRHVVQAPKRCSITISTSARALPWSGC
jgi:hypothetical protein